MFGHSISMCQFFCLLALIHLVVSAPLDARQNSCGAAKGPGVCLHNQIGKASDFFFYKNSANGNGWAVPSYDVMKRVHVPAGRSTWVPLNTAFKGRVQRANAYPSTWVEFQTSASNDHKAHGDISFIQGFDGPAVISSMKGDTKCGVKRNLIKGAPDAATVKRKDGKKVLANTEFSPVLFKEGNLASRNWLEKQIGLDAPMPAYTRDNSPACVVNAKSQQLRIIFH